MVVPFTENIGVDVGEITVVEFQDILSNRICHQLKLNGPDVIFESIRVHDGHRKSESNDQSVLMALLKATSKHCYLVISATTLVKSPLSRILRIQSHSLT